MVPGNPPVAMHQFAFRGSAECAPNRLRAEPVVRISQSPGRLTGSMPELWAPSIFERPSMNAVIIISRAAMKIVVAALVVSSSTAQMTKPKGAARFVENFRIAMALRESNVPAAVTS